MPKLKLGLVAMVSILGGYLLGGLLYAQVNLFTNGDFETGDLSGWTQFTTGNGTMGEGFPKVVLFDTNGDGTPTKSAQFSVGQVSSGTAQEGGGVYQNVYLTAGDYSLTVDIAGADDGTELGNGEAGLFELMLDGVVVDSYDFGAITSGATKHSLLAAMPGVLEGDHEIRIRITRPVRQELSTVTQYLDNVVLIEGNTSTKGSGNNTSNGNGNSPDCTGNKGGNRDSDNSGGSHNKKGDKHCD